MVTLLDFIAGTLLLISVYRKIDWKFVFPVLMVFFPGAYLGAHILNTASVFLLRKLLAIFMFGFIALIFWNSSSERAPKQLIVKTPLKLTLAFLAGFGGGLIGISGPLLVIYFKLAFSKSYFRTQLIAIFAFGAAWRLFLYHSFHTSFTFSPFQVLLFVGTMLLAIFAGSKFHLQVDPRKFDRAVALILVLPSIALLF